MTEKVTVRQAGPLPMPLIYLASPEDLAQWYVSQLSGDAPASVADLVAAGRISQERLEALLRPGKRIVD